MHITTYNHYYNLNPANIRIGFQLLGIYKNVPITTSILYLISQSPWFSMTAPSNALHTATQLTREGEESKRSDRLVQSHCHPTRKCAFQASRTLAVCDWLESLGYLLLGVG